MQVIVLQGVNHSWQSPIPCHIQSKRCFNLINFKHNHSRQSFTLFLVRYKINLLILKIFEVYQVWELRGFLFFNFAYIYHWFIKIKILGAYSLLLIHHWFVSVTNIPLTRFSFLMMVCFRITLLPWKSKLLHVGNVKILRDFSEIFVFVFFEFLLLRDSFLI